MEHLRERQEVWAVLMEVKMNMQKTTPEVFQRQIFQELTELGEQRTKEALQLVQRKHKLIKFEGERERPRQFLLWFVLMPLAFRWQKMQTRRESS